MKKLVIVCLVWFLMPTLADVRRHPGCLPPPPPPRLEYIETNIRIGFSRCEENISKTIQWFTGGKVSHAFLIFYDKRHQKDFVLEATDPKIQIIPLDIFLKSNEIVGIFKPNHPIDKGFRELKRWVGRDYNYSGFIGMAWVEIGKWLGKDWPNFLTCNEGMFCTEAISNVLWWSQYPEFHILPDKSDPEELLIFCLLNMKRVFPRGKRNEAPHQ